MKLIISILSLVVSVSSFATGISPADIEIAKQQAVQDLLLTEKIREQESKLFTGKFELLSSRGFNHHDPNCDDRGVGSEACWQLCRKEGYGSSTCASRCGVTSREGSAACWSTCTGEGYGSSTCASRCGVTTREGIKACWDKCSSEGYGSSTCGSRCGVN